MVALVRDGAAGNLLGTAAIVGRAVSMKLTPASRALAMIRWRSARRRAAENHGAEAAGRHLAPAHEIAVVHVRLPQWRSFGSSAAARRDAKTI